MKIRQFPYRFALFVATLMLLPGLGWGQTPIVAEWNFENLAKRTAITDHTTFSTSPYRADNGSISNRDIQVISLVGATFSAWVTGSEGTGSFAPNATNWNEGNGSKSWQIKFSTNNFEKITVSSRQQSSDTGPKDFKLQYSLNGLAWFDVTGGNLTVANNFTSGVLNQLLLPDVCNNKNDVFLRWIMTSNSSVVSGTVGSAGTSRIDQIIINGFRICGKEETFFFSNASGVNTDGNFTGNDGVVWRYFHARNEGSFPINLKGLMLHNASQSKLETSTIPNGIESFSMQMRKAFTNDNPRQLELYVNSVKVGESVVFGDTSGEDATVHTFTINEINIPGNFTLMIKNVGSTLTERHVVIDNIFWTCYIEPVCATTTHFYRSKQNGNWEDISTWESSSDGINWTNAQCAPDYRSAGINIMNGHQVSISGFLRTDQTIIEAGGVLIRAAGNNRLIIHDGPGDDLVVFGVFRHGAGLPAPDYQGTMRVKTNGVIQVQSNNPSASHYGISDRIFYENNAVLFWDVAAGAIFLTSNQTYFPNSGLTEIPVFRLSTPNITVGAGSQTAFNGLFEVTQNTVTFQHAGAKTFRNGITGTGRVIQAEDSGDFIINGQTARLDIAQLELKRNLTITTLSNQITGSTSLSLTGANPQTLSLPPPNPLPVRFANLITDNPAGVSINQDIQVSNTLTMTRGNIDNQGRVITVGESVANAGQVALTAGSVFGALRRWVTPTNNRVYLFPVGKPGLAPHAEVQFTAGPTNGGSLTAEFISPMPDNYYLATPITIAGTPPLIIDEVPNEGFWRIDAGNGLQGFTYTLNLSAGGITQINMPEGIRVLKRNLGDNASNYRATPWNTGSNQGSGFGNWDLWTSGGSGSAGHFVWNSTQFGHGNINTDLSAFGMFGHTDRWAHAQRSITNWDNGFEFHADFAVQWRDGSRGISLRNSSGNEFWNFNISNAGYGDTGWLYHSDIIISLRAVQNGSNINITLAGRNATGTWTGAPFSQTVTNQTLAGFRFYTGTASNTGDINNNKYNLYFNNLRIISPWSVEGTTTHLGSNKFSVSGLTSFSDFTLGGFHLVNPLPIELLSFTGKYQNNKVFLNWATGSEINNDYFTLERSHDAINAEILGFVQGAGNSSRTRHYRFTDYNPLPGVSYYRLKQTDFDGSFEYSNWVAVEASAQAGRLEAQVINQPQGLLVRIFAPTSQPLQIILSDIYGRIVYNGQINPDGTGQTDTFLPVPHTGSQVLLYRISDGFDVVSGKVAR